jgi:hypothetical protein
LSAAETALAPAARTMSAQLKNELLTIDFMGLSIHANPHRVCKPTLVIRVRNIETSPIPDRDLFPTQIGALTHCSGGLGAISRPYRRKCVSIAAYMIVR